MSVTLPCFERQRGCRRQVALRGRLPLVAGAPRHPPEEPSTTHEDRLVILSRRLLSVGASHVQEGVHARMVGLALVRGAPHGAALRLSGQQLHGMVVDCKHIFSWQSKGWPKLGLPSPAPQLAAAAFYPPNPAGERPSWPLLTSARASSVPGVQAVPDRPEV